LIQGRHAGLPICDPEGRIQGLVTDVELLRGVQEALLRVTEQENVKKGKVKPDGHD
jgi:hypothetical protein